ncbi:hypothetical protein BDV27DRAFT_129584 [Aspergillus caelatus]|uniref:Uncharacterized protein n=1 Tax=Aspergillus caelatus TaxID=61420 RepID=A0A5N7A3G1_9EURO|nr:uncharacterized protein BDV27DRAFT_129584 [Aspergillus caelatus]KAE8363716.1 hypothetical protein BDV27DRAFT_129584 [Aspergillus caelatus]
MFENFCIQSRVYSRLLFSFLLDALNKPSNASRDGLTYIYSKRAICRMASNAHYHAMFQSQYTSPNTTRPSAMRQITFNGHYHRMNRDPLLSLRPETSALSYDAQDIPSEQPFGCIQCLRPLAGQNYVHSVQRCKASAVATSAAELRHFWTTLVVLFEPVL